MTQLFGLTGRTALVTGSSHGIGRAIAEGLAAAGARVVVHGAVSDAEAAQATAAGIPGAIPLAMDLGAHGSAQALAAALATALPAPPDILVLNAAIQIEAPWDAVTPEDADRQLGFNLREQLALVQALVPPMRARCWGRIVAVGSVQSARPNPNMIVYAATKAALVSMMRNLAKQLAPDGITANVLSPGAIETRRNQAVLSDPAYRETVLRAIPAGRLGTPADCVGMAQFLCSDAAAYVTGTEMRVDGGLSL